MASRFTVWWVRAGSALLVAAGASFTLVHRPPVQPTAARNSQTQTDVQENPSVSARVNGRTVLDKPGTAQVDTGNGQVNIQVSNQHVQVDTHTTGNTSSTVNTNSSSDSSSSSQSVNVETVTH